MISSVGGQELIFLSFFGLSDIDLHMYAQFSRVERFSKNVCTIHVKKVFFDNLNSLSLLQQDIGFSTINAYAKKLEP